MIIALLLLVTITFANCLNNDFIGDDKALFVDNQFYTSLNDLPVLFSKKLVMDPSDIKMFTGEASFSGCISYRPVPAATFFIDYAIWQKRPLGHHFTNLLFHALTVILVFLFFSFLTGRDKTAFFAAILFAVHPIHSEVVNTIGYRSDLLAGLFYLLALVTFVRWRGTQSKRWYLAVGGSYFLALFSKETALTLPFVIFFLDLLILSPGRFTDILNKRKWLYVLLAGITVFYLYIYFIVMPNSFYPRFSPANEGVLVQSIAMLRILANYLAVLFLPFKVTILPPLYSPEILPLHWWELLVPLAAVLIVVLCAGHFYRKNKLVTFAFIWIFLNYLPISGAVPLLNPFAFRFLYLPSIGFFLLAALVIEKIVASLEKKQEASKIGILLKIALVGLSMVMTISNNGFFRNDFVACHEMVRNYPGSSRPYWVLGFNYYQTGKMAEAEKFLEKYVGTQTNNPFISDDNKNFMAYHLLGRATQDPNKAIIYFNKALSLNPRDPMLYLDIAKSYILKRNYPAAVEFSRTAIAFDPDLSMAYVYIVHSYMQTGDLIQARQVLEEARKTFKDDPNLDIVERYLKGKERKNDQ